MLGSVREPLEKKSIPALVESFRDTAARRGWELDEGNPKQANAAFDFLEEIWAELSRRSRTDALRTLLTDEDPGVRLAAAARLL